MLPQGKTRLELVRDMMGERGYDAVVLRNNPDIRWLTDAARVMDDEVAHTVVITAEGAWLHTDSRYYGAFQERLSHQGVWDVDMEPVDHPEWVAALLGGKRARVVAIEDSLTLGFFEELEHALNRRSAACLLPRLHQDIAVLRMVKDAEEIEMMRRAQRVTDEAFLHICGYMRAGMTELEVRAELEGYMLSHGADSLSFDTIIASGPNGANPHARPGSRKLAEGDLVVMDYGAAYGDYHSDMTRTVCIGTPSAEQVAVYEVVRRAHEECAARAVAGVTGRALHEHAVEVISEAGYGEFFNHGLGHGVGLEIHERPFVGRRGEDPIPQGAVFTIEPGIYLPGRFGIRLEDFGVMGEQGYIPFTESSHDLACIG